MTDTPRARALALVGATATGKTGVAEAAADRIGAEIVCADSRQVYRELEIGTGKPEPDERAARPHHLFDALEVDERASAGWYARVAAAACREILGRGRVPLLVGGSGLYLEALRSGLCEQPPRDPELRARLVAEAEVEGVPALHARLGRIDPPTAARLHPRDAQRVTRALEVFEASGQPLSWWQRERKGPALDATWRMVELCVSAAALAERIAVRTHRLFASGLVEETRDLVTRGRGAALRRLRAVGYDEALDLIAGRVDRSEAEERTSARTRQLAKRQRTWFRHRVEAVRIEAEPDATEALARRVLEAWHAP